MSEFKDKALEILRYVNVDDYDDLEKDAERLDQLHQDTSDGYHTFDELYDHRMALTAALVASMPGPWVWKSKAHHPDGDPMFEGFFIVGIDLPKGPITYHYKLEHWDLFPCPEVAHAPAWDGHTPADVVDRLKAWVRGQ